MVIVIFALGLASIFGFLLLNALGINRPLLSFGEQAALGYGLGLGLFTYLMFAVLALHIRLSFTLILGSLIFLTAGLGLISWSYRRSDFGFKSLPSTLIEAGLPQFSDNSIISRICWIILIVMAYFWVAALITAIYWPVWTWDSLTMFEFRGRAIFLEQNLDFLKHELYWGSFPLLTSLAHAFVYYLGGTIPKIIYPLYYLALIILFYINVSKISGNFVGILFTALLTTTPLLWEHATIAYTNLTFTFYYAIGVLYVYRWVLTSRLPFLLIGAILLGFSAWTRYGSEPLFLAVLLPLIVYAIIKKQPYAPFLLTAIFILFDLPWLLYQRYILEVRPTELYQIQLLRWDIPRLQLTLTYLGEYLTRFSTQGTIWLVFILLIILSVTNLRRQPSTFLGGVVLLGFGAWVASIYLTRVDVNYLANASGERLLLSFLPIAGLYCAVHPLTQKYLAGREPVSIDELVPAAQQTSSELQTQPFETIG